MSLVHTVAAEAAAPAAPAAAPAVVLAAAPGSDPWIPGSLDPYLLLRTIFFITKWNIPAARTYESARKHFRARMYFTVLRCLKPKGAIEYVHDGKRQYSKNRNNGGGHD